mgnify:FL=1
MHTTDRIINDVAVQLANKIVECANYKAFYEEAQEQLARINNVLEADEALKELFDEVAQKGN